MDIMTKSGSSCFSPLRRAWPLVFAAALGALASCADRPLDFEQDWSEEVERICNEYCDIYMPCESESIFGTRDECMDGCTGTDVVYWDDDCGDAWRDILECTANASTCDEYDANTDIHADDYPCKAVHDRAWDLKCGSQDPP